MDVHKPYSIIECLPVEILEEITRHLAPTVEERIYPFLRCLDFYDDYDNYDDSFEGFKEDCASAISEHPVLSQHVRRVIFIAPLLAGHHADYSYYRKAINGQVHLDFSIQVGQRNKNISHVGLQACTKALEDQHFPYTEAQMRDGHEAYLTHYRAQCKTLKRYMLRLEPSQSLSPTVIEKRYPDIVLDHPYDWANRGHELVDHTVRVLRALAVSRICLQELTFAGRSGKFTLPLDFSWTGVPGWPKTIDLHGLRRLDIGLHTDNDLRNQGVDDESDWSSTLCPILKAAPRLEELLGISKSSKANALGLHFDARVASSFFTRHTGLRELSLDGVYILDKRWRTLFTSLREQPTLHNFEFSELRPTTGDGPIGMSTTSGEVKNDWYTPLEEVDHELNDYIHGRGKWTEALSDKWGST
ncbi:hypothetical protein EJ08DRAFT_694332 [Tothia fuscella]|uniref:Uncharacterized protein n=1 Tax=Tothia fuscella TaxID=1048955 RepID=A0A9P4NWW2_9PEZI|nr:hypothetical protein EJ08DRAFT_694332 [Tothia fuscella]